jgi:hypothetical protein
MAPVSEPVVEAEVGNPTAVKNASKESSGFIKEPLKLSGALDQFDHFDVTPVIGREFTNANLKEWLRAPNSNELLRDLAITS